MPPIPYFPKTVEPTFWESKRPSELNWTGRTWGELHFWEDFEPPITVYGAPISRPEAPTKAYPIFWKEGVARVSETQLVAEGTLYTLPASWAEVMRHAEEYPAQRMLFSPFTREAEEWLAFGVGSRLLSFPLGHPERAESLLLPSGMGVVQNLQRGEKGSLIVKGQFGVYCEGHLLFSIYDHLIDAQRAPSGWVSLEYAPNNWIWRNSLAWRDERGQEVARGWLGGPKENWARVLKLVTWKGEHYLAVLGRRDCEVWKWNNRFEKLFAHHPTEAERSLQPCAIPRFGVAGDFPFVVTTVGDSVHCWTPETGDRVLLESQEWLSDLAVISGREPAIYVAYTKKGSETGQKVDLLIPAANK
ncbi:MAG: hypothetical protein AB7F31_04605 [Parachlamydiales bacterium]